MKEDNKISIVVASDNHYAILIAALLKSIEVNHKTPEHIDFYIIDDGIAPKTKTKLETIADPARITLKWRKSKEAVPKNISIPIDNTGFPLTAYLRVFAPYVLEEGVEKMIYLDVDTIVQDDISNLWNKPLGDFTIGAIQDVGKTVDCAWGGIPNYKELGLSADTKYFNSGVLLVNAKKWLKENISEEVILTLSKYKEHVVLVDQYALNVVFANKWQELDPKWNWPALDEDKNPSLIHFLDVKPTFKSYKSQEAYKQEFYRYLRMTPWKNFKPVSGNYRYVRKFMNKVKKRFMKLKMGH